MKDYFLIFIYTFFILKLTNCNTVDEYLKEQSKEIQNEFQIETKEHDSHFFNFKIAPKGTVELSNQFKTFTVFNVTYVISDKIYILFENETIEDNQIKVPTISNIKFVKTFNYFDLNLIAFGLLNNKLEIFEINQNSAISFVQRISVSNPVDINFFINQNRLYFVLASSNEETFLYKWLGSYFDETDKIYTKGVHKIHSFQYLDSEIIMIFQETNHQILEFRYEKLKRNQQLVIKNVVQTISFQYRNESYIVAFSEKGQNRMYRWKGTEFWFLNTFQTNLEILQTFVLYQENTLIFVLFDKENCLVYKLTESSFNLVAQKKHNGLKNLILSKSNNTNLNLFYIEGNNVSTVEVTINLKPEDVHHDEGNVIESCFNNLEKTIDSKLDVVDSHARTAEKLVSEPLKEQDVSHVVAASYSRVETLLPQIQKFQENTKTLHINGKTFMDGNCFAKKVKVKDIYLKNLNNHKWTLEQWLQYSQNQTITGEFYVKTLSAKKLKTNQKLFDDLLIKKGSQNFTGLLNVENLSMNKMYGNKINNINLDNLYLKSKPGVIRGKKSFKSLKLEEAKIHKINGKPSGNILSYFADEVSPNSILDSNVFIKNLWVEEIDNINWEQFKNSRFRMGVSPEIKGNLVFTRNLMMNELNVEKLSDLPVENILTTSTHQNVSSTIVLGHILAENVKAKKINGVKLEHAVSIHGDVTEIEGPVKINVLNINKEVKVNGDFEHPFVKNGEHILGTQVEDMHQIYTKPVRIKGNLYVNDIKIQENATMFLDDTRFNLNDYWTRSTDQKIVRNVVANNGISTPELKVARINNIDFNSFMKNTDSEKPYTIYHFENVTVYGDVNIDEHQIHTPDLKKMDSEAVKNIGSWSIQGNKTYVKSLRVENADLVELDGITISDTLTTSSSAYISGKKFFKNLIVKGDALSDINNINYINGLELSYLLNNYININEPSTIEAMSFADVTVLNLQTTNIDEHYINEYILNLEKSLQDKNINNMYINGDISIQNTFNTKKINDVNVTLKSDNLIEIIKFLGHVKVNNLRVREINNVNLETLAERILYRTGDQEINATYSFSNLKTENLKAKSINKKSLEALIDINKNELQQLYTAGSIKFQSVEFTSFQPDDMIPCNLNDVINYVNNPPSQSWKNVNVLGNAVFLDQDSPIYRIFKKTVKKNNVNTILAPTTLFGHIFAENILTSGKINDINLQDLIEDAILTNSEEDQIISGQKVFFQMHASNAFVETNADIPMVNDIHIPLLNNSIISINDVNSVLIKGKKVFFGGVQAERVQTSNVSNINPDDIVSSESDKTISNATFESLEISNRLEVNYINNIDFNYVLENRLLRKSDEKQFSNATYFFDDVEFTDNLQTPNINTIEVKNIIFDIGEQEILSPKTFKNDLKIDGDVHVNYINGKQISEIYENALMVNKDAEIEGSMSILFPTTMRGNIQTETLNGYPMDFIIEVLNKEATHLELNSVYKLKETIYDTIKTNFPIIQKLPSEYMYLESCNILKSNTPNTTSAKIVEAKGRTIIHLTGQEPGSFCGLPEGCKCPTQETMEITPQYSYHNFFSKGSQRIYTYDDDEMIANFITNSVSSNSKCRTDKSKVLHEISSLTWNTVPSPQRNGSFYMYNGIINGYIRDVEFFTIHNQTYAVISRSYDPVIDSHDSTCIVIKFTKNKSAAESIQEIPTSAVQMIYLFHTAQGVVLVVGNNDTEIYRFDDSNEEFKLLRTIPLHSCTSAAGVVLGTDSLIILAYKETPILILKYDVLYDQYSFYQTLPTDDEVSGTTVFYSGGFGISDAYLSIVTESKKYYIYSYQYIAGWKLKSFGQLPGLISLIPFKIESQPYLFAPSNQISTVLKIVNHG